MDEIAVLVLNFTYEPLHFTNARRAVTLLLAVFALLVWARAQAPDPFLARIDRQHAPAAHTDGDSIVFFRKSDVVATGDIYRTDGYPVIDATRGGTIQGVIDGLLKMSNDDAAARQHVEHDSIVLETQSIRAR